MAPHLDQHPDGALERRKTFDAGIAQTGRMTSIVVILDNDKAMNDAASPRKALSPEDVIEAPTPSDDLNRLHPAAGVTQ